MRQEKHYSSGINNCTISKPSHVCKIPIAQEPIINLQVPKNTSTKLLSPVSQQSHNTDTKEYTAICKHLNFHRRTAHVGVEHELVGEKLNQTGIHQNTRTDGIKDAIDEFLVNGTLRSSADSSGNSNRSRDGKAKRKNIWQPTFALGPRRDSKSGAKTKTFKKLMEDQDNEKNNEVFRSTQGQSDKDTVEDNTEFENKNGGKLASQATMTVAILVLMSMREMVSSTRRVANVVRAARNGLGINASSRLHTRGVWARLWVVVVVAVALWLLDAEDLIGVAIAVVMVVVHVACSHQLDKEHDHDCHERDKQRPGVFRHLFLDALVAKVFDGRVKQMHPGGGDNDTAANVFAYKKGEFGHVHLTLSP